MLKVLLSQDIPESMLSSPRGSHDNASQLAEAAGVSVMSAFRFVRQLSREGFLEENGALRLVRIEELLQRWLGANQRRIREIPVRWIIRGAGNQIEVAVRSYVSSIEVEPGATEARDGCPFIPSPESRLLGAVCRRRSVWVEVCPWIGAARCRTVPHIYLKRLDREALAQLGMSVEDAEHRADAIVRIPENPNLFSVLL